ncbi:MAG TPA: GNAT family N-acetyltransferase [Oceanipulchritudo sp.]|nr:GNAT family N-acetyltransferase [Oceanipulchritudo sp.]
MHTPEILLNPYEDPVYARAIVDVLDSYASDPMGGGVPLPVHSRETLVGELRRRDWVVTLLALIDDQPVGLLIAMEGFSTFKAQPLINIHDVAVVPTHRGQGIGQALFAEIEKVARERGCCKITLEVLTGNERAKRLYQHLGFRPYELDPNHGHAQFWEKPLQH